MNKQKLIELRCKAWGITEDEYYCNQCSDFSLEDMARAYRRGKNKGAKVKEKELNAYYQNELDEVYKNYADRLKDVLKENEKLKIKVAYRHEVQTMLEKRIEELEEQIEKMKCCFNCKHSRTEYEHCKTDKHEKWEIKEND